VYMMIISIIIAHVVHSVHSSSVRFGLSCVCYRMPTVM